MSLVDIAHLSEVNREDFTRRIVAEEARRPFDLQAGPLFRAQLIRRGDADYVLSVVLHHIIADGWSIEIIVREVAAAYRSLQAGSRLSWSRLPIQYGDFAAWQRRSLQGERLEQLLHYWRGKLAGAPPTSGVPTDFDPVAGRAAGGISTATVPGHVADRLTELARTEGTTLFAALFAAFHWLLSRHADQDDLVIGSPVANRALQELEGVVGFFANSVALRTDTSNDPTFRGLLRRVKATVAEAIAHQELPFEKLVAELRPERSLTRHPIFQVMFVLRNAPASEEQLELRVNDFEASQYDLTLYVEEAGGGFLLTWEYDAALYRPETIEALGKSYLVLLGGIVERPDERVSTLPLLDQAEKRDLIARESATAEVRDEGPLVHELVAAQALARPEAVAVEWEGGRCTYEELERRASTTAARLEEEGVGAESRVGIVLERSIELMVAVLGTLKAGGAYVPVDPELPRARQEWMLQNAGVTAVIAGEGWSAGGGDLDVPVLELGKSGEVKGARQTRAEKGGVRVEERNLAYVIYTSGSTGRPKGVMSTHGGLRNRLLWMRAAFGVTAQDVFIQKTPIGFDVSVWELLLPLMSGARLFLCAPGGHRDAAYLLAKMVERGVTVVHFVPAMLRAFLEEPRVESARTLRAVICSGEELVAGLVKRFQERSGARLHNLYGPTEASIDVSHWACGAEARRLVPIGEAIWNTQLYVLDEEMQLVPAGVAGDLYIGGVGLARGYLQRPDLTASAFVPDPYGGPGARLYRTGDLARRASDGALEYLGRRDHQIKLRGIRIELGEIEAALRETGQVKDVVVVPHTAAGDVRLVAYVVPHAGAGSLDPRALRVALSDQLPVHSVPGIFASRPRSRPDARARFRRPSASIPTSGCRQ